MGLTSPDPPPSLSSLDQARPAPDLDTLLSTFSGVLVEWRQREDVIIIDRIIVDESLRGRGLGSNALQAICDFCDRHSYALATSPSEAFGTSKSVLNRWYCQAGFVSNRGKAKDYRVMEALIRPPRSSFDIGV